MTPEEAALEKRYREISDQIAELGTERGTLINKNNRTAEYVGVGAVAGTRARPARSRSFPARGRSSSTTT